MEDPMPIGRDVRLPLSDLEIRTSRSSGPGGQHANVSDSRVEVVFDVFASAALSESDKARIVERLGPRPHAVAQDTRSQARNRELALKRLRSRLAEALHDPPARRPTRPSRAAHEQRLNAKRRRAERKAARRRPASED